MVWSPRSAVAMHPRPLWSSWAAHPALAAHVSSYWVVRGGPTASHIKVLPDACVDVTFDLSKHGAPRGYIAPSQASPVTYPLAAKSCLFGARVFPQAAALLIGSSLASLDEGWTPLEKFLGKSALTLARKVDRAVDDATRSRLLDAFFIERLVVGEVDARVTAAVEAIFASGGTLSVTAIARRAASSERTLGRLFSRWVGLTPKRFARIVRFQHALRRAEGEVEWAALADELGYFDQAHLINDMQELFGAAPGAVRRDVDSLA
jgi:AraC-like DNA-binding protein